MTLNTTELLLDVLRPETQCHLYITSDRAKCVLTQSLPTLWRHKSVAKYIGKYPRDSDNIKTKEPLCQRSTMTSRAGSEKSNVKSKWLYQYMGERYLLGERVDYTTGDFH